MKRAVFVAQVLLLVLASGSLSAQEKSPEIPEAKFSTCSSKDQKQVISTIKAFSLARVGNQEKVPCTPGSGGFDQDGHIPD